MNPTAVLAFSGGLDTTYCAVWLRTQGYDVHTVCVQTGGFSPDELAQMERHAQSLGVAKHVTIDARDELFTTQLRFLIYANALRGDVYPLSVSAERTTQAASCALYAASVGAAALVHGSTGAGNDQVRFDVAFRVLAPGVKVVTPIRDQALSREAEAAFLAEHGVEVPPRTTRYSVNRGLWGTTIGGGGIHRSDAAVPAEAFDLSRSSTERAASPETIRIGFEHGVPISLNAERLPPVPLVEKLDAVGGRHGVGRGVHVGDTIIGIKGRVAFDAPAPTILIGAHRELEKLVLSRQQLFWKRTLGELYGSLLHEARYFDPLMRDLEAFLESTQRFVTGEVTVRLGAGTSEVLGAHSPHSLMAAQATYGETSTLWSGDEAAGFAKLYGMQDQLAARVAATAGGADAALD